MFATILSPRPDCQTRLLYLILQIMRGAAAALLIAGVGAQLPTWPMTYQMNRSTILMVCKTILAIQTRSLPRVGALWTMTVSCYQRPRGF